MAKVITFGELMLRLQPFNYERFVQATSFEATFGGGEANVAVSLANYGFDAEFVTKLPAHSIGQMAVNSLRQYGVGTKNITRGGNRVGIRTKKNRLSRPMPRRSRNPQTKANGIFPKSAGIGAQMPTA